MNDDENRPYGTPKTEEERKETHEDVYGSSELPERGTGIAGKNPGETTVEDEIDQVPMKRQEAVRYAAHLETIRINRWRKYDAYNVKTGSLDTTTQNIDSEPVEHGWIHVITNIVGLETGTKATTVALGYVNAGKFHIMHKETPATNNDSAEYVGQIILTEGDIIRAEFKGATEGDTAELFANGYKIRM